MFIQVIGLLLIFKNISTSACKYALRRKWSKNSWSYCFYFIAFCHLNIKNIISIFLSHLESKKRKSSITVKEEIREGRFAKPNSVKFNEIVKPRNFFP